MTVEEAIENFRCVAENKGYHNQIGAFRRCGDASANFVSYLRFYRLPITVRIVDLTAGERIAREFFSLFGVPTQAPEFDSHCVVQVDKLYYDWTRRQYQRKADFPHVATREEMEAEGWIFEEDALCE